jgi:hypothetical protein
MSEWLTTGQMIDRLKVGEVAESKSMSWRGVIVNSKRVIKDNGVIRFEDSDEILSLNAQIMDSQWSILPKYVSFEEAKVAYENGKIIGLHNDNSERVTYFKKVNNEHLYSFNKENWSFSFVSLTWREILEGKWTIEE